MSLLIGVALAVGSLAYVLYPLFAARTIGTDSTPATSTRAASREVTDAEIEAAIRSYRARQSAGLVCSGCGTRPEPDALYCSSCGRRLAASDSVSDAG